MPTLAADKKPARSAGRNGGRIGPGPGRRPVTELIFGDLWEFDPAPETADPKLKPRYELFINGQFVAPRAGKYFDSINPANEQKLAELALGGEADVDAAYAAATRAFETVWARLPGRERGKFLYRVARLLQDRAREFAVAETMDNGKPIRETRDFDVPMCAAHFFYHGGWADKLEYVAPGRRMAPLGVVGQVIPWNFPLLMLSWKIAPALAAGNCVVIKPASNTSITAVKLAEIFQDAGLPPGVVNVITGPGATGGYLMAHPAAAKIAFTGSTEVGKVIMRSVAGSDKRMTMELGGKAANIVFDDAPIDQAVEGIVNGIFFNQGQVCCAGSRLLVHEPVADLVVAKLKQRLRVLRVGDPLDKNTDVGAIVSRAQLDTIQRYLDIGVKEGAEMWQPPCRLPAKGYFMPPTIFTGVTQSHCIAREEIFGPVLSILTFRTIDEAIEKANNTAYGLSAGVWTDKGSRILKMSTELKAGVVWANTFNKFDPTSPFGGYKESGFGREGGRQGLLDYARLV
ncbi:MAG TPA: aldehyde dehydrogenase family protein [Opitutaceae bacterium]|nr:aldehyde dehydrogenase family protein [Opitutaceae bacterium]